MDLHEPAGRASFAGACEEMAHALAHEWMRSGVSGMQAGFRVFGTTDFSSPIETGVSVYLYHVEETATIRAGLQLHLLLTIWAPDTATEHTLAEWTINTLRSNPVLSSGQVLLQPIPAIDMVRLWRAVTGKPYRLSLAYLLRTGH